MTILLLVVGLLLGLALSGFFSGMETGYYSVNKLRLALYGQEGDRPSRRIQGHLAASTWLLTVLLVGNNLANYLATYLSGALLNETLGNRSETLTVVLNLAILTPILFVVGEVAPKALFRARPFLLTRWFSGGITLSGWLLWPLVHLLQWPAAVATRLTRGGGVLSPLAGRQGLQALLGGPGPGGGQDPVQAVRAELAGKVMDLHRVKVEDVMLRLKAVTVLPEDMGRKAFLKRARARPYLRFPVHAAGNAREVTGYVYLLDMLYDPDPEVRVRDHLRRLDTFPPHMPADQALVLLQRRGSRIALVAAREGAPLGIVTVTDMVERITGALPERRPGVNLVKK